MLILPVEGIMNIREYMQEMNRVEITKTIAHSIHDGKQQMKAEKRTAAGDRAWAKLGKNQLNYPFNN